MISLDEQVLADLLSEIISYRTITQHFGLSDAQAKNKNAGSWIVDCVKQYQTSFQIAKSMKMFQADNMKVENYATESPLPDTNPLIGKTKEGV